MKKSVIIFILCLLPLAVSGQNTKEDLDKIFEDARTDLSADVDSFNVYASEALEQYLEFEAKLREEYEEYRKKVMAEWGEDEMVESTKKVWVEYGEDDSSRTVVDFETGKVTVEVLADPGEDEDSLRARMEAAVGNLISSKGRTVGFNSSVAKDMPITDRPIMAGQLDLSMYVGPELQSQPKVSASLQKKGSSSLGRGGNLDLTRRVTSVSQSQSSSSNGQTMAERRKQEKEKQAAAERAAAQNAAAGKGGVRMDDVKAVQKAIVEKASQIVQQVNTSKGKKNILKIELELVEDHIPKRAEQFKAMIRKHSKAFTVEEPLIFAIMEQESAFNPAAKSHVPAYGLMQLVPRSGGRDAYRFVHKKDVIPSADFLYDPDNNIELGTGYLRLLMTTSFAKVEDPRCRMLCAIAAYNTGAGNVSRAITGNTNISKAIPQINQMNYDQLFSHLKRYLPHAETQDYIQKVTSKMQKYIK